VIDPNGAISMTTSSSFSDALRAGLAAAGVEFEDDAGQLKIPARHPDVGDLLITLDDGEITVFVGNFTHRHFTPTAGTVDDAGSSVEDCVREAIEYVCGILNDQWVLWAYPGGAGGSYRMGSEADPSADAPPDDEVIRYVWSGPYDPRAHERTSVQ
jgi:hypothetical protein